MGTQMIIRIEPKLKEKAAKLARAEGKTLSALIRELLENYSKERSAENYIDELWASIGEKLAGKKITKKDVESVVKKVRKESD